MKTNNSITDKAENGYRTTDIYLSAFLIAGNHAELSRIEPSGARRKVFVLNPCPNQGIIQSFYNKEEESKIPALDVLEALASLKDAIYHPEKITSINGGEGNE